MAIDTSKMDRLEKRLLSEGIAKALEHVSIHCAPTSGWTEAMSKECFHKCMGIWEVLRCDMKFSPPRASDELPQALRCHLEKVPWEPKQTSSWVVADNVTPGGIILPG